MTSQMDAGEGATTEVPRRIWDLSPSPPRTPRKSAASGIQGGASQAREPRSRSPSRLKKATSSTVTPEKKRELSRKGSFAHSLPRTLSPMRVERTLRRFHSTPEKTKEPARRPACKLAPWLRDWLVRLARRRPRRRRQLLARRSEPILKRAQSDDGSAALLGDVELQPSPVAISTQVAKADVEAQDLEATAGSVPPQGKPAAAVAATTTAAGSTASPTNEIPAEFLLRQVLRKSGRHADKAMTLLRERVVAGRKVHGRLFTKYDVAEAMRLFRKETQPEAAREPVRISATSSGSVAQPVDVAAVAPKPCALMPFKSSAQPLAYQGSFMPPAAVSRLVGDEVCAICLEPLRQQAQTIALCGHIFHRSCLNDAGSIKCPTCRQPVDMNTESLQELRSLIRSTRMSFGRRDAGFSNVLEFTRKELLEDCNRRRRSGVALFLMQSLEQALAELAKEAPESLVIEEDLIVLLM